jgi:endogenous inhibitor of DNA gyrase (YacG/DUF329 family)
MADRIKWALEAWDPDKPRYVRTNGINRSTVLWRREYHGPEHQARATAVRAAGQVHHRYPEARIELIRFVYRGLFWIASDPAEPLMWCPTCGNRMDWVDDSWHCPSCGDEWQDDIIRPWAAREGT